MFETPFKRVFKEALGERELFENDFARIVVMALLFFFASDLELKNCLNVDNGVFEDLLFEQDRDAVRQHGEGRPEILAVEQAILADIHQSTHSAAHVSHGEFNDLDGVQTLSCLVKLLKVFDVLHAVICENFDKLKEIVGVDLERLALKQDVKEE